MTPEKPRYKKDEPDPIPMEEAMAQRAACEEIANRPPDPIRRRIVNRILDITGRVRDSKHSLDRATQYMVKQGYLQKPAWMVKTKPWFSLFTTEELIDAYTKLQEEFVEPF